MTPMTYYGMAAGVFLVYSIRLWLLRGDQRREARRVADLLWQMQGDNEKALARLSARGVCRYCMRGEAEHAPEPNPNVDRHRAFADSRDEGYRLAFKSTMDDPHTPGEPCDRTEAHRPHLWRHVRNGARPDVDETLKRCAGFS